MSKIISKSVCEFDNHYSVIVEDDGRVAYAYILDGPDIVGHVWLYNQQEPPETSYWQEGEMPFLNPKEYLSKDASIKPIRKHSEIRTEWTESKEDGSIEAGIYIRDKFIASVEIGSKPGWSTLVIKDGPLALVY